MQKQEYEALKQLGIKVSKGIATFAERNVWNIIQKKKRKNQPYYFNGIKDSIN